MGRRSGPYLVRSRWRAIPAALALCALSLLGSGEAAAQSLNERIAQAAKPPGDGKDRLLVNANEMVYDKNKNQIGARGNVQLYYQGRTMQADRVVYDRNSSKVHAEGRVKTIERDGTVSYADRLEITDNFRDGFIDSLRVDTIDRTFFTAARAERSGGDVTVMERGTYTACEACKEDPSRPPFWQIRAKRIIHDDSERMVYFEDASIELFGKTVGWLPYFSIADPSVTRKSGFLPPHLSINSTTGIGVGVPIFWAMAPNYDLTFTPFAYSRQGPFGMLEWRHQLASGAYAVRGAGIYQLDPKAFAVPPYGPGDRRLRGSLESWGQFHINERWKFGWDITAVSDKWFHTDYRMPTELLTQAFFREATSKVYLTGQSDTAFFDLTGYYFKGLYRSDIQRQQPLAAPVLDYHKVVTLDPKVTAGVGGQVDIDVNALHLRRELAAFQSTGLRTLDAPYGLYDICAVYNRANCFVRGIGGDYTRLTASASWKRQFIDPIGQVWTPFAFARLNGVMLNLNQSNSMTFGAAPGPTSTISNGFQSNFFGVQDAAWRGTAIPGVGLEYRYPLMAQTAGVTHVIEPIAQVIARPNEPANQSLVNEDAQSLVFDDTNLFQWSKFSGYDRFEGGLRLNYGAQYTANFAGGGYFNALIGQSQQLQGRNSYATPDAANTGLGSGLDTRNSDVVTRFAFAPSSQFAFISKARFDPTNYALRRLDLAANARFDAFDATLQYARYDAQPQIGFDRRREGIGTSLRYRFDNRYFVTGNVTFDMSRHLYNNVPPVPGTAGLFSIAALGFGLGYADDCTTLSLNYSSVYLDRALGQPARNQTLTLNLQLRTLGETRVQTSLGEARYLDGLSYNLR